MLGTTSDIFKAGYCSYQNQRFLSAVGRFHEQLYI